MFIGVIWNYFFPGQPPFNALPDMTGQHLDMQYLINAIGENKQWPRVGDLVIKLESCGMGQTVRRDIRYRVNELRNPYATSFLATRIGNSETTGIQDVLHIFYLRKHVTLPRVWILCN